MAGRLAVVLGCRAAEEAGQGDFTDPRPIKLTAVTQTVFAKVLLHFLSPFVAPRGEWSRPVPAVGADAHR